MSTAADYRESAGPAYLSPMTLVRENPQRPALNKRAVDLYQPGMLSCREISRRKAAALIRAARAKRHDCAVRALGANDQRHYLLLDLPGYRWRPELGRLVVRVRMACPIVNARLA